MEFNEEYPELALHIEKALATSKALNDSASLSKVGAHLCVYRTFLWQAEREDRSLAWYKREVDKELAKLFGDNQ